MLFFAMLQHLRFHKSEPGFYYFVLFLHLLPIILLSPFVTLDGPAHLYNARLIQSLWSNDFSAAHHFFSFNPFPEPNWICHGISACLLYLLPAGIVEKIILFIILLTGALGFRKLNTIFNPNSGWLSWMYFPFLYNFTFSLGFFNFALGFSLLPWILVYWMKFRNRDSGKYNLLVLSLMTLFIYFSHLVIFLVAILFMGMITMLGKSDAGDSSIRKQLQKLLLISLPGLLLTAWFLKSTGTMGYRGEISYLKTSELLNQLYNARMFVIFNYDDESRYSRIFFKVIFIFTIWAIYKRSIHKYQKPFLGIMLLSLVMVFIIPDSLASGGILSVRMVQLFYLCWCFWILALNFPEKGRLFIAFFSAIFSLFLLVKNYQIRKTLSEDAIVFFQAAKEMKEESIVMPLNYGSNWLHSNLPGYIGAEKKMLVLDNYEPTAGHFPLIWKNGMNPESDLGNFCASNIPCITILNFEKKTGLKINYITVESMPDNPKDSCSKDAMTQLNTLFRPLPGWTNKNLRIFIRK
jgi:hypothetical protein